MLRTTAVSRSTVQPQRPNTSESARQFHTLSLQSHLPEKTDPREMFDLKKKKKRINLHATQHTEKRKKTEDGYNFTQAIMSYTAFTALIYTALLNVISV